MRAFMMAFVPLTFAAEILPAQTEMYDGRPAFAEGVDLAYYLWRDGDKWHVRWTTQGRMRAFGGSVTADNGKLGSVKRIDVESESRVLYPGRPRHVVVGPRGRTHVRGGRAPVVARRDQDHVEKDGDGRIIFAARTNDDIDGFDFKVDNKVEALRFVLNIDGRPMAGVIEVGKDNHKPGALPLFVRLKPAG